MEHKPHHRTQYSPATVKALYKKLAYLRSRADAFKLLRTTYSDSPPLDVTVRTDRSLSVPTQGELFKLPHQLEIDLCDAAK